MKCLNVEYDVVLSFAGEDRKYVEGTASYLKKSGVKVFYDVYEDINLWGKDLYQHLDDIYQNKAKYAVIFISENYSKKLWTNHELKSAQARAFSSNEEYILPARFDNSEIPGIRKTIGYVNLSDITPIQFAKKIIKKLGVLEPENFLPKNIKYVKQVFNAINDDFTDEEIETLVTYVFKTLKQMNENERKFLASFILNACPHDITEDLHEDITLIERVSGFSRNEIIETLKSLTNLGFEYKIKKSIHGKEREGNKQKYELLSLSLITRHPKLELYNLTMVLFLMYYGANNGYCETCYLKALQRLNFSGLKNNIEEEELESILSFIPEENED